MLGPMKLQSMTLFVHHAYHSAGLKPTNAVPSDGNVSEAENSNFIISNVETEAAWAAACSESFRGICAILFTASDTTSQRAQFEAAVQMLAKSGTPFKFLQVNAQCQRQFSETMGVYQGSLPSVAAYAPFKARFAGMFFWSCSFIFVCSSDHCL